MHVGTDRGTGTLGPIGSFAHGGDQLPVEFEARYRRRFSRHKGGLRLKSHIECVALSVIATDGRQIPSGVYYLHADYNGTPETMRVSNQNGEWRRLSRCI
jgi:hypothetical protein